MNILAIETATESCSVALLCGEALIDRTELAPRRHAELVLPMAEELLAEAGITRRQIDGIAMGQGPGAFTGVRLAVALAQGIALALDRPVVPVSTLAALAALAFPSPLVGEGARRAGEGASQARHPLPNPSPVKGGGSKSKDTFR